MDYVIFSFDNYHDLHTVAKFTRYIDTLRAMGKLNGGVVSLIGSWDGKLEYSFLTRLDDFNRYIRDSFYVDGQQSFMFVCGDRMHIHWGDGVICGRLVVVTPDEAFEHEGWTYRIDTDTFYLMEWFES